MNVAEEAPSKNTLRIRKCRARKKAQEVNGNQKPVIDITLGVLGEKSMWHPGV